MTVLLWGRDILLAALMLASLFLLWAAVAGVVMSLRSAKPIPSSGAQPVATARA